ncbi:hypothetical protein Sjap_012146 [Stephania japonica]|uniref:DUF3741 domain-containing protein n=1 Tax=Stephania japonica TaxID=461633 RepID=A0AAP0NY01_9MAGN
MMKRAEGVLSSSSSRRNSFPENHHPSTKSIGCMSGIFHLVSKYSRRRKFLTAGKKQEKSTVIAIPSKQITPPVDLRRLSCDVERSPTIPSEIRRSSSVNSPHRPPAIVAKLMGLSDATTAAPATEEQCSQSPPGSAAEKRRKLLEALEKCDEDLKSLKKIIEAVRSYDHRLRSSPAPEKVSSEAISPKLIAKQSQEVQEQNKLTCSPSDEMDGPDSISNDRPSPVSVLDEIEISSSPSSSQEENKRKKQREETTNLSFFHRMVTLESLPRFSCSPLREDQYLGSMKSTTITTVTKTNNINASSTCWNSSKAKIESVMEVCEEAVWEERWEVGRIGVMLEDFMLGDLIEETVGELGHRHHHMYVLPFEACKRKLCF